jgi:CDP-diacylglycerol---serine O-phosphatidyltransferase
VRLAAPNAVTFVAMYAGLTAIRYAIDGAFQEAAIALALAGLADRLDGAVARLLRATSRFGAEFDSFADVVSFGVGPALIMYVWALREAGAWGFLPAVAYIACAALRLTWFNLTAEAGAKPAYARHFYIGMTSPAGAAIAVFPLLTALEANALHWPQLSGLAHTQIAASVSLICSGLLMIAPFPLLDFVHVRISIAAKLIVLVAFLILLAVQPWLGLMLLTPFALLMLAVSPAALRRRRAAANP